MNRGFRNTVDYNHCMCSDYSGVYCVYHESQAKEHLKILENSRLKLLQKSHYIYCNLLYPLNVR